MSSKHTYWVGNHNVLELNREEEDFFLIDTTLDAMRKEQRHNNSNEPVYYTINGTFNRGDKPTHHQHKQETVERMATRTMTKGTHS